MPGPNALTLLRVQCLLQCDAELHYQMATTIDKARETAHENQKYMHFLLGSPWVQDQTLFLSLM